MLVKSQRNIKALELDEFEDRLNVALSNLILVKGVPACGKGVRTGWPLGSFPTQPIL